MKLTVVARRFLLPSFLISLLYWVKYRCFVSPRAEVEYSPLMKFGPGTQIGSFTKMKTIDGPLIGGARVTIGTSCVMSSGGQAGLEIGDDSKIGSNVAIIASNYRYDRLDIPIHQQGTTSKGIRIGKDVWVGNGAAIMDGVTIGDGAIITPNSVVTANVPELSIAQGNPAKVICKRQ